MKLLCRFDDVRVEPAAQALVGGDHDEQNLRVGTRLTLGQQRMSGWIDTARHAVEHSLHLERERAGANHAILRAAQLRRRDHLHGFGDLLRRFHRADAAAEVKQRRHRLRRFPRSELLPELLERRVDLSLQRIINLFLFGERLKDR